MILDYSESVRNYSSFGISSKTINRDLYFDKRGFCIYCKKPMDIAYSKNDFDTKTLPDTVWHKSEGVWVCDKCGWWEHSYHSELDSGIKGPFKDWECEVNSAILKRFDIDSLEVPIFSLQQYLKKFPDKIINIHDKKMENLVAAIFSEHFNCEANVVGKSQDGGIDIILVNADKPIVVQVKRRTKLRTTESVAPIRELIGATLLNDSKDCIFVTSANKFSKQAIETKNQALSKGIVKTFELFDRHRLIETLHLGMKSQSDYYKQFIRMK